MDGFPFVHRETVRFRDLDAFGHVNNAVYLTYLEQARVAFLRSLGLLRSLEDMRMILARVEVDFRAQATIGDELEVGVRAGRFGTKSFALDYELRVGERLVAEATSVLVAFDYERQQTVELPEAWRSRLAA